MIKKTKKYLKKSSLILYAIFLIVGLLIFLYYSLFINIFNIDSLTKNNNTQNTSTQKYFSGEISQIKNDVNQILVLEDDQKTYTVQIQDSTVFKNSSGQTLNRNYFQEGFIISVDSEQVKDFYLAKTITLIKEP